MKGILMLFVLGIVLALIGIIIMFEGALFKENTIAVAIIICLIGFGLIATSSRLKAKIS